MQQADGWHDEWQGSTAPAHGAQSGDENPPAPGRQRWMEKIARKGSFAEARHRMQPANTGGPGPESANPAQSLAGLIHDARNMVSAIDLYCDLLEEPGVLSAPFHHYAAELRLVSGAGRRLLEDLAVAASMAELQFEARKRTAPSPPSRPQPDSPALPGLRAGSHVVSHVVSHDGSIAASAAASGHSPDNSLGDAAGLLPEGLRRNGRRKIFQCGQPIANLAEELSANHNLLAALTGPAVTVGLAISGGRRPVAMTGDDLTRVLVNLARNAAEAMPRGGHLQIALEEGPEYISLSFTDNGPGIPEAALETIFAPGYTTRSGLHATSDTGADCDADASPVAWPVQHRGLGLSIVRSIVAAAGGSVWAANRKSAPALHAPNLGGCGLGQRANPVPTGTCAHQGAILIVEFPLRGSPVAT